MNFLTLLFVAGLSLQTVPADTDSVRVVLSTPPPLIQIIDTVMVRSRAGEPWVRFYLNAAEGIQVIRQNFQKADSVLRKRPMKVPSRYCTVEQDRGYCVGWDEFNLRFEYDSISTDSSNKHFVSFSYHRFPMVGEVAIKEIAFWSSGGRDRIAIEYTDWAGPMYRVNDWGVNEFVTCSESDVLELKTLAVVLTEDHLQRRFIWADKFIHLEDLIRRTTERIRRPEEEKRTWAAKIKAENNLKWDRTYMDECVGYASCFFSFSVYKSKLVLHHVGTAAGGDIYGGWFEQSYVVIDSNGKEIEFQHVKNDFRVGQGQNSSMSSHTTWKIQTFPTYAIKNDGERETRVALSAVHRPMSLARAICLAHQNHQRFDRELHGLIDALKGGGEAVYSGSLNINLNHLPQQNTIQVQLPVEQ